MKREIGSVEAAVLADIAAIGTARPGQITLAEQAIGLARTYDGTGDVNVSRELRLVMSDYRFLASTPDAAADPDVAPQPVVDSIDELKARRRLSEERRRSEGSPA